MKIVKEYKWYIAQITLIILTIFAQYLAKYRILPIANHFIPDSYSYELRVLYDREMDFFSNGLTLLNGFIYNTIGTFGFTLINTILLLASIYLCRIFSSISSYSVSLARIVIVFNPYYLVGVIGPNKETYLLFACLLVWNVYFSKIANFKGLALVIGFFTMFIRSYVGLITLITIILAPSLRFFKNPVALFVFIVLGYFMLNAVPAINSMITDMQGGEELVYYRSSSLYPIALILIAMTANPILQIPAFAAKTIIILVTPILRPNPFLTIPFPLLDSGYSIFAYILMPFNLSLLFLLYKKKLLSSSRIDLKTQVLCLFCLIGILSTIVSPTMSFRYIFPYTPYVAALFPLHSLKVRNRILVFCLITIAIVFTLTLTFFRKEYEYDQFQPVFMNWF